MGFGAFIYSQTSKRLNLLNKMAGGLRRRSNEDDTVEESFGLRTAPLKEWTDLIAGRKSSRLLPRHSLEDFTKSNVIRLGLETDCPHCNAKNWSTLTVIDYRLTCERCLKPYDFPQAKLREHEFGISPIVSSALSRYPTTAAALTVRF